MNIADFRSDTVTKPTASMLKAMIAATVGDDVFGEDTTINLLENKVAQLFGFEAGLFCPSGTMANQIAIKTHTQPLDEVICDKRSHVYLYEGGGMMFHSGVSVKLVDGDRGILNTTMIANSINPKNDHYPQSTLVTIENTMNKGGGSCYEWQEMIAIGDFCKEHHLKLHIDGARIFNAYIVKNYPLQQFAKIADSISICFSKGLGAPVGSVLISSKENIQKARRFRKTMGGGMRQAGYLAAACLFALDNHIERLKIDHQHAEIIQQILLRSSLFSSTMPVETNIVIAKVSDDYKKEWILEKMKQHGVWALAFGENEIRFVTHLDISQEHLDILSRSLMA